MLLPLLFVQTAALDTESLAHSATSSRTLRKARWPEQSPLEIDDRVLPRVSQLAKQLSLCAHAVLGLASPLLLSAHPLDDGGVGSLQVHLVEREERHVRCRDHGGGLGAALEQRMDLAAHGARAETLHLEDLPPPRALQHSAFARRDDEHPRRRIALLEYYLIRVHPLLRRTLGKRPQQP